MQHLRGQRVGRRDHSASGVVENAYVILRICMYTASQCALICEVGDPFVFFGRTRARDIASAGQYEVNQAFATKYATQQPMCIEECRVNLVHCIQQNVGRVRNSYAC